MIDYAAFVESMFILVTILGLLYLRWVQPDLVRGHNIHHFHHSFLHNLHHHSHQVRPIRVSLGIPITFLFICTFLVFLPLYVRPLEVRAPGHLIS